MKKLLLLPAALIAFACSSDDSSTPVNNTNETYIDTESPYKTISIVDECDAPYQGSFCVSDETFAAVYDYWIATEDPCPEVNFVDIDGVERSGLIRALSYTNNGCTRPTNP